MRHSLFISLPERCQVGISVALWVPVVTDNEKCPTIQEKTMTNAAAITNFEQLYKKHYRIVAATIFKFRLSEDVADDLIQETFIEAWNKMDTLENADAFGSWVSMIARNLCLNHVKKVKKHQYVSVASTDVSGVKDE